MAVDGPGVGDDSAAAARLRVVGELLRALDRWDEISEAVGAAAGRRSAVLALQRAPFGFDAVVAELVVTMGAEEAPGSARARLEEERDWLAGQVAGPGA